MKKIFILMFVFLNTLLIGCDEKELYVTDSVEVEILFNKQNILYETYVLDINIDEKGFFKVPSIGIDSFDKLIEKNNKLYEFSVDNKIEIKFSEKYRSIWNSYAYEILFDGERYTRSSKTEIDVTSQTDSVLFEPKENDQVDGYYFHLEVVYFISKTKGYILHVETVVLFN
jgi:hypothetical protein